MNDEREAAELLNDTDFFKAAAINNVEEIIGKEKSVLALRNTFNNIKKAE